MQHYIECANRVGRGDGRFSLLHVHRRILDLLIKTSTSVYHLVVPPVVSMWLTVLLVENDLGGTISLDPFSILQSLRW